MMEQDLNIDARLLRAQVAISNAKTDPEILDYLGKFKYDTARLDVGWGLYETARELHQRRKTEFGEQQEATAAEKAAHTRAQKEYIKNLKVARVALDGDVGAFARLALNGRRKRSLSGWLAQTRQFYINALNDSEILAKLDNFGITQEILQAGKQLVDDVETANANQEKEKGEAQQATKDRDAAVEEMDSWMSDYEAIARIALEDKPQLLEKLGFKEPS